MPLLRRRPRLRPLGGLLRALAPALAARRRAAHERRFYGQFVRAGELCFDVGACRGRVCRPLLALGARVVAVEANPALASALAAALVDEPALSVEAVALGAAAGSATLHLADEETMSTVSARFVAAFGAGGRRYGRQIEVPMTTLDALIARHGRPVYVKIDVEGLEPDVLAGLSAPIAAVSFEANAPLVDVAVAAAERLAALGDYVFAFSPYEELVLSGSPQPMPAFAQTLRARCAADAALTGDVYAWLGAGA